MKRFFIMTVKVILLVSLCLGVLVSCGDDDDNKDLTVSNALTSADPSYGFMVNSSGYQLLIDFGEEESFELSLVPGQILQVNLQENRTYVLHVVVLDIRGGAISEYINTFFIDDIPLDNQFRDILCSWYVEFTSTYPEYGFANKFGT